MIRLQKRFAIFFYAICMFGVALDVVEIIKAGIDFNAILVNMIFVVFGIPAVHIHKWHRQQIKKYTRLLKESGLQKIEYMIYNIDTVRGRYYSVMFFINGEKCKTRISEFGCKKNNNYEYYLEPIYKKNGQFKDFIAHLDKERVYDKSSEYLNELREYEEKMGKSFEQRDKWDKYINSKM